MYVCDDILVCSRRGCMCVMIFQCVGGECVCVLMIFQYVGGECVCVMIFQYVGGECVCV